MANLSGVLATREKSPVDSFETHHTTKKPWLAYVFYGIFFAFDYPSKGLPSPEQRKPFSRDVLTASASRVQTRRRLLGKHIFPIEVTTSEQIPSPYASFQRIDYTVSG